MGENKQLRNVMRDGALPELAEALIKRWKDKNPTVWSRREADAATVESGLRKILSAGLMTAIQLAEADLSKRIKLAMSAIELFQAIADVPMDGILGRKTFKSMADFRSCNERTGRGAELPPNSAARRLNDRLGSGGRLAVIICNISPEVEDHFDRMFRGSGLKCRDLIIDAWDMWSVPENAGLARKITETDDPDNANILITLSAIDGREGGTLADAHIGGPTVKQQLTLRIDEEENFTTDKFKAVVAHELGHILGLHHIATRGHLMSAFFDPSRLTPTDIDLANLRRTWLG